MLRASMHVSRADMRWRNESGHAVANCSKPCERASEEAATHTHPLAHRSSPSPACHCLCATAVPPPALACSAAHAAMLGEPANREMADVSMVCSRSGSQRAMMISRGAAMRMHEWRITQGLRSHVSCVHEVTHLRRELVLGRRVVLGDVRLHVPTDRPTAMEDG